MYPGQVNSRETITTSALNATDTSLTVLDGGLLPDAPNLLVLGAGSTAETVLMTAKTGNTLTIQRGFQGVPKTWALGTVVARNYTEYDHAAMLENITDVEGRLVSTDAKVVENTSAIGQKLVVSASNIPIAERKEGSFYFIITDQQAGGNLENIKVSPTMGLKIV